MNKEYIKEVIMGSMFVPRFKMVSCINVCADMINIPHEDYPTRVKDTAEMIRFLHTEVLVTGVITESMISHVHSVVMNDLPTSRGVYRKIHVHPNGGDKNTYFNPIRIKEGMENLFPIYPEKDFETIEDYIKWYHAFQIIHPFEDGNGRVGGIVLAAACEDLNVAILAPCQ